MSLIDPRAIIDPTAILADNVEVGPGRSSELVWNMRVQWLGLT